MHSLCAARAQAERDSVVLSQKEGADRLAEEREQRIEHLKRMAMRRMKNQGLTRGWSAWSELWEQASMQRRLLAGAASRLTKPKL
eukprot:5407218-Prymnesium_polylepis.4